MFDEIISVENILLAWREFVRGKRAKADVQLFERNLMDHILSLHDELANQTYRHGDYHSFHICDPKPRHIHKAPVRDRLVHHAIHRVLYQFFSKKFIDDSFSCQIGKGMHRAGKRFQARIRSVSRNNTRTCWVLKCDIRKFFASIDQNILLDILRKHITDERIIDLLSRIIHSFSPGLPLGNLTSQLLVNVYMNEFDQWVKHHLKAKHYIRYADDFVFLHHEKSWLEELLPRVGDFLQERLHLQFHPNKVSLTTIASGVDFLGWVHFPDHRVLRTATKRRVLRRTGENYGDATLQSYLGLLGHGNAYKIEQELRNLSLLHANH